MELTGIWRCNYNLESYVTNLGQRQEIVGHYSTSHPVTKRNYYYYTATYHSDSGVGVRK
jgi:hypothetical protein